MTDRTALDAAWEALEDEADDVGEFVTGYVIPLSAIARHRPAIEAEARAPLDVERPVERPVVATRCVCSHHWVDHTTWCDSNGCPCRFTGTADRHGADARAPLDGPNWDDVVDGLEVALSYPAEMEVNRERWRAARINLLAALAALEEPTPWDYWRRQLADRHVAPDLPWTDADVMRVVKDLVTAHDEARAPLDVERLARALQTQDREQEADFNAHGRAYTWERKAAGIAREYVALEEPTP